MIKDYGWQFHITCSIKRKFVRVKDINGFYIVGFVKVDKYILRTFFKRFPALLGNFMLKI